MREVTFQKEAFDEFTAWASQDVKAFERLTRLIRESARDPFTGIGKPEPLRYNLKGCWSRRLTDEHRLVYRVNDTSLTIVSCRFHY